jgi:preprotein translocase subunit SecD
MKKNPGLWLMVIILVAVAAGIFVYPKSFGATHEPWKLGLDLVGGAHLVYQVDLSKVDPANRDSVVAGLRDVIEKRVNLFGVSEPQVYSAQSGATTQLIVDLAGVKSVSEAIKQIGETPLLQFADVDTNPSSTQKYIPTNLTGEFITGAQLTFDQTTGAPQVSVTFNAQGTDIFAKMTQADIGKPIAIFLDGQLIEAPVVQTAITNGNALITGNFTVDSARLLVERFNAGALAASIIKKRGRSLWTDRAGESLFTFHVLSHICEQHLL